MLLAADVRGVRGVRSGCRAVCEVVLWAWWCRVQTVLRRGVCLALAAVGRVQEWLCG